MLVFDGIKMGAEISVNGAVLGQALDQFVRYTYTLTPAMLKAGSLNISVKFDPSITVKGRFMACTGGWDWGK